VFGVLCLVFGGRVFSFQCSVFGGLWERHSAEAACSSISF
jgi:hypothetical protein